MGDPLGESLELKLCEAGHLDTGQIRLAREELERFGSLQEAIVRLGFIVEADWIRAVCQLTHAPAIDLTAKKIESEVLALVSPALIEKHRCLPLFIGAKPRAAKSRSVLYLGLENPLSPIAAIEVERATGLEVRPVVVGPIQLSLALDRFYPPSTRSDVAAASALVPGDTSPLVAAAPLLEDATPEAPAEPDLPVAVTAIAASFEDEDDAAARGVETRIILQALTKLLVASGAIDRTELFEEVIAIRQRERLDSAD